MTPQLGDNIEVIDTDPVRLIRGKVIELDTHPLEYGFAKIRVDSPALPAPEIWVSLRNARKS